MRHSLRPPTSDLRPSTHACRQTAPNSRHVVGVPAGAEVAVHVRHQVSPRVALVHRWDLGVSPPAVLDLSYTGNEQTAAQKVGGRGGRVGGRASTDKKHQHLAGRRLVLTLVHANPFRRQDLTTLQAWGVVSRPTNTPAAQRRVTDTRRILGAPALSIFVEHSGLHPEQQRHHHPSAGTHPCTHPVATHRSLFFFRV